MPSPPLPGRRSASPVQVERDRGTPQAPRRARRACRPSSDCRRSSASAYEPPAGTLGRTRSAVDCYLGKTRTRSRRSRSTNRRRSETAGCATPLHTFVLEVHQEGSRVPRRLNSLRAGHLVSMPQTLAGRRGVESISLARKQASCARVVMVRAELPQSFRTRVRHLAKFSPPRHQIEMEKWWAVESETLGGTAIAAATRFRLP